MRSGMGIFATRARGGALAAVVSEAEATAGARGSFPGRFEAVAERLAAGHDASDACAMVGREMARDGADLGEALDGLRTTYARVLGGEPDFPALHALGVAWSEEMLGYLHQLSCENPLTGLASLAHLRARLSEVYRAAEQGGPSTSTSHALVVLDLPLLARPSAWDEAFESTLRLVRLAERARQAFPGEETICQASPGRVVVLARRGELLAQRVRLLRDLVEDLAPVTARARVWIEGLPPYDHGAGHLLDELARS
jgi:antitoxin (DNA-binding transcriptional repressor) of toxin-antitoxin stability system